MTPSARVLATIELLDALFASWQSEKRAPADKHLDTYFKTRRYIGSKDRGTISELFYWIIRHKAVLEWWCARQPIAPGPRPLVMAAMLLRKEMTPPQLSEMFNGAKYAPAMMNELEWQFINHVNKLGKFEHAEMPEHVRLNYPQWIEPHLTETFGKRVEKEMSAMLEQAPVDLRVNTLLTNREELIKQFAREQITASPTPHSLVGIRLKKRQPVFASPLFKQGCFEMQDEGSQMVSSLVQAEPGMKVIDFCAGAGGKTLAIAAQMKNKGRILAWDTSAKRLAQLPPRLRRAGVSNTEWREITSAHDPFIKRHKGTADRVLIDVPCSGTGTWRRNPDLKWRFTENDLNEVLEAQGTILASAARLVKPGGRLIYATCSLLACENEMQVKNFLKSHANFRVVCAKKIWNKIATADATPGGSEGVSYLWLTPQQDGVDGFFAAVLERDLAPENGKVPSAEETFRQEYALPDATMGSDT